MQLKRGLRIARPFGIPLLVHISWFPAALLLVSHFTLTVYADIDPGPAVALGVVSALLFFASLVAHELGHALVARALGIGVADITLFIFGGVARIVREPTRPAQEFVIAIAGPIVSAGIGLGALAAADDTTTLVGRLLWTIGVANIALALFNLLPGFPLDGGRILRAILWARSGNLYRATIRAGRTGQAIGFLLVIAGVATFVVFGAPGMQTGGAEGLWLAVVGGFLIYLAGGSRRSAKLAAQIGQETTGHWARPFSATVPVDSILPAGTLDGSGVFAVLDGGRLAGVLLPRMIALHRSRLVRDLMVPWTPRLSIPAAQPLARALERLAGDPSSGVLVVVDEQGSAIGVLDQEMIRSRLRNRLKEPRAEQSGEGVGAATR